ncbi:hypothetical protein NAEX_01725 [Nannocystis exedens]|nr:hypothetical protein NAEX_01725 [Nannocystis exedens]
MGAHGRLVSISLAHWWGSRNIVAAGCRPLTAVSRTCRTTGRLHIRAAASNRAPAPAQARPGPLSGARSVFRGFDVSGTSLSSRAGASKGWLRADRSAAAFSRPSGWQRRHGDVNRCHPSISARPGRPVSRAQGRPRAPRGRPEVPSRTRALCCRESVAVERGRVPSGRAHVEPPPRACMPVAIAAVEMLADEPTRGPAAPSREVRRAERAKAAGLALEAGVPWRSLDADVELADEGCVAADARRARAAGAPTEPRTRRRSRRDRRHGGAPW